jgi:hypothetical protein
MEGRRRGGDKRSVARARARGGGEAMKAVSVASYGSRDGREDDVRRESTRCVITGRVSRASVLVARAECRSVGCRLAVVRLLSLARSQRRWPALPATRCAFPTARQSVPADAPNPLEATAHAAGSVRGPATRALRWGAKLGGRPSCCGRGACHRPTPQSIRSSGPSRASRGGRWAITGSRSVGVAVAVTSSLLRDMRPVGR